MWPLVRKTASLERESGPLRKRVGSKSLSGQQILKTLIVIADEADKQFAPDLLTDFWKPFDGNYLRFVRNIAASLGLNERPLYHPHEPFGGYNQHHFPKKISLARLFPYLQVVDSSLLAKTGDNEEFLLVSYHLWHTISSSTNYFDSRLISGIYERYLKLRSIRERSEVEEEITNILKPHQVNPSETPLEILTSPRDLFEHKKRLFSLPQKSDDYHQNDGGLVDIIWAFGVYTKWPELIGYVLFNEQLKDKNGLFLPRAEEKST